MGRKKKTGPKPKRISRQAVIKLARLGCTQIEIADFFGVDNSTISRRYAEEFHRARAHCKLSIRRAQIICGTRKLNPQMLMHLGKYFLDQSQVAPSLDVEDALNDAIDEPPAEAGDRPPQVS